MHVNQSIGAAAAHADKVIRRRVREQHLQWAAGAVCVFAGLQLFARAFNDAQKGYRVAAVAANRQAVECIRHHADSQGPDTPAGPDSAGSVDLSDPDLGA